jgi:ribonucleoside-triphosphate reductase
MVIKVQKRDKSKEEFNVDKIKVAVWKALTATKQGNGEKSQKIAEKVAQLIGIRFKEDEIPNVEQVQDIVEEALILEDEVEAAKAYIIYREQRRRIREQETASEAAVDRIDDYLDKLDWEVQENSNMTFSLQGMNHYGVSYIVKKYWLNKIYPKEVREANDRGDFHLHNLDTLGCYCVGWDLYDVLLKGFGGVSGKIESTPPKHFRAALGQIVNFMYTLQGEAAGAVSFSNFDTLLAPFIRYDNLNYNQVEQAMQEFMYNMAVPTRVGFQCPFTNVTLDLKPSSVYADQSVIIGGEAQKETYADFEPEMKMLVKAFYSVMLKGDKSGRPFSFPIPTINITKDFDWEDADLDKMWEASTRYGINNFANYINSDMDPSDARSMCCRLRLDLTKLSNRGGGGLFGSGVLTGSIGVVTVNLPRLGYLSKTKKEFLERLGSIMDIAKESLELKRKTIEDFTDKGLYPYSKHYLAGVKKAKGQYFKNHFATIGIVGMHEALLNFMGEGIDTPKGKKVALEIMDFMRERLVKYQTETGSIYNLEATPAESTAYRLAQKDRKEFKDIITSGTKKVPYYTNSTQLPVNYTDDIFEELDLQDELQCKYTGGTTEHVFLGEELSDIETGKKAIKKFFETYKLPFLAFVPTFSICPIHGYIAGKHFTCPKCTIEQPCEVYSRVVGYLRPVTQWNEGKQQEFKDRKVFKVKSKEVAK